MSGTAFLYGIGRRCVGTLNNHFHATPPVTLRSNYTSGLDLFDVWHQWKKQFSTVCGNDWSTIPVPTGHCPHYPRHIWHTWLVGCWLCCRLPDIVYHYIITIVTEMDLKKWCAVCGLHSSGSRKIPVTGCCGPRHKPLVSHEAGMFFTIQANLNFSASQETLLHGV